MNRMELAWAFLHVDSFLTQPFFTVSILSLAVLALHLRPFVLETSSAASFQQVHMAVESEDSAHKN